MTTEDDESVQFCDICGCKITEDSGCNDVDDCIVCDDCYNSDVYECSFCGDEFISSSGGITDDSGNICCPSCWNNGDVYRCEICRTLISDDSYSTSHYTYLCEDCYDENKSCIRDYHDAPGICFRSINNDCLYDPNEFYLGIELEMENGDRDDCAKSLSDRYSENVIYFEQDSSLDDDTGVELITQPMTLEFFRSELNIKNICKIALDHDMRSHDAENCGLHIHISKNHFGECEDDQDLSMLKLIYILDKFRKTILKISRRTSSNFDHYCRSYNLETPESSNEMYDKNDHYSILSIRDDTVEFRAFRGTLKYQSIYAAVDFYLSIVAFARNHTFEELRSITSFSEIREYLVSPNDDEPDNYLSDYLNTRLGEMN